MKFTLLNLCSNTEVFLFSKKIVVMKNLRMLYTLLLMGLLACKNDVPNPSPRVVLESPTAEKPSKNLINKPIRLKFSVYDKDGLGTVSADVTQQFGGPSVVSAIPIPSAYNGIVSVDTTFVITSLAGKDSLTHWVLINTIDGQGNPFTLRSSFKVYKKP